MKDYAVKLGIPSENIITPLNLRDTVGDAFFTKHNVIVNREWKNILVLASEYHIERTSRIFKFIYGSEYAIKVIGSSGFDNTEKQVSEKNLMKRLNKLLKILQKETILKYMKNYQHFTPSIMELYIPKST